MEQFLGALEFTRSIGRTLVLPHLVEYPKGTNSAQIPFNKYFKVEPLRKYTKVILMDDFMKHLALIFNLNLLKDFQGYTLLL